MTLCGWGGYDQLCCQASPKLLLGLDLGLGCDNLFLMHLFGHQGWFLINSCEFIHEFLMSLYCFQNCFPVVIFGFGPVYDIYTI